MEEIQTTPPAPPAPPMPGTPPAPPPPEPPTPPAPPAPPFEQGGNINNESWLKSIDWLQAGLIFLSAIALLSVVQYHRLKIKNLKSDIPAAKKRMDDMDSQIQELAEKKLDKRQPGQKPNIGL